MSINIKDWKKSKYPHIKINKKDKLLYLFDVRIDGKRYRKQYRNTTGSDVYVLFLEWKSKLGIKTTDGAETVLDYFNLSQKLSERNPTTKLKYDKYFALYITPISSMKIQDVKSSHIDSLNNSTKHLKPSYRKKMFEILIPMFSIAIDDLVINVSPIKKRQVVKRKQMQEMRVVTNAVEKYKNLHKAIHEVFKNEPRGHEVILSLSNIL